MEPTFNDVKVTLATPRYNNFFSGYICANFGHKGFFGNIIFSFLIKMSLNSFSSLVSPFRVDLSPTHSHFNFFLEFPYICRFWFQRFTQEQRKIKQILKCKALCWTNCVAWSIKRTIHLDDVFFRPDSRRYRNISFDMEISCFLKKQPPLNSFSLSL